MRQFICTAVTTAAGLIAAAPALADTADEAEVGASLPAGSFVMNAVTLLVLVGCVLATSRLYAAIRGGQLARGWMWLLAGFVVFACGQLLVFGNFLGVLPTMYILADALRVVSLLLFFIGIGQLRKLLA